MQDVKVVKIGSINDPNGIVMDMVYQHPDGSVDAGDIGSGRNIDDLQQSLRLGFSFRPCKSAFPGRPHVGANASNS